MSSRLMMPEQKKKRAFTVAVICLSAAILVVLLMTFIPKTMGNSKEFKNSKAATKLTNGFSCQVDVSYDGNKYVLNVKKPKDSGYEMNFVKPDTLSNLSFQTTAQGLKVKFGSLETVVDPKSIPQKSIYDAIITSFDSCLKNGVAAENGKETVVSGKSSLGDYKVTFDSNMCPKSISIPQLKLDATISNFKTT